MGHGAEQRNRALAMRCWNLRHKDGHTYRTIAEMVGKKPEQIKALVALGERVRELYPTCPDNQDDWSAL